VIFVMGLATAVCYPINKFLLVKNDLEYLQTIVFILVIAALVQCFLRIWLM
ncbi:MAG: electron transport complex subunit RsxA, partial [Clostridia bacterium]|nr:electron transport complex subunit RsxA [Clostridia bacterium]